MLLSSNQSPSLSDLWPTSSSSSGPVWASGLPTNAPPGLQRGSQEVSSEESNVEWRAQQARDVLSPEEALTSPCSTKRTHCLPQLPSQAPPCAAKQEVRRLACQSLNVHELSTFFKCKKAEWREERTQLITLLSFETHSIYGCVLAIDQVWTLSSSLICFVFFVLFF